MKIFLSSRLRYRALNERIGDMLSEQGHTVWCGDPESKYMPVVMESNDRRVEAPLWFHVAWAVGEADCLIVLFMWDTMDSYHVLNEAHYALYWSRRRALAYLPLVMHDVSIPEYMNNRFHTEIDESFGHDSRRNLLNTIDDINLWLKRRHASSAEPTE